jgi:hypothetical protein
MRIMFVLIRMHAIKHKTGKLFDLPYEGEIIKQKNALLDIEFDLVQLPLMLQHMLCLFLKRHLENQEVNRVRCF